MLSQQQAGDAYSCAGEGKAKKEVMLPLELFKALQVSQLCSQDAVLGPRLGNCTQWGCFCAALALRIICMFLRVVFKKEKKRGWTGKGEEEIAQSLKHGLSGPLQKEACG